jgi:hypothetical protein
MSLSVCGQQISPEDAAMFARYPAGAIFHGKPVKPDVTDPDAHMFRTRIRAGAAQGVVFAGHYALAVWGCGAGCTSFAVIDAITGQVHFFPASISQVNEAGERLTYRKNSRAIHVIGSLNEENSADRWFLWDGHDFKLISEKPVRLLDDQGNESKL